MKNEVQALPQNEMLNMAKAIANSNLFGVKNTDQAMALMFVAESQGLHPATVAMDYHIIQGRPALKADAILGRFQSSGGCVKWPVYTDSEVVGVFSHPKGGEVEVKWNLATAENAGLFVTTNGQRLQKTQNGMDKGNWHKYPRQMLRARCISEGVRTVFPSVMGGMYVAEEVEQFEEPRQRRPIQTEATIITEKKKKELTPEYPKWEGAKKALKQGTISLEHLKNVYEITPENEAKLLETETQTTETEGNQNNESI